MVSRFIQSCCTTRSAMWFWAAACTLLYGIGLLLASVWPPLEPYADTLILLALGIACLLNFGRNRTLHCAITRPLFLVGAVRRRIDRRWNLDLRPFRDLDRRFDGCSSRVRD